MHLRPIQLEVRRSVIHDLKMLSKEVFPKEAFAYLLGRDAGNLIEIEDLWVPLDLDDWNSETGLSISDAWQPAAKKVARDLGLSVVGDAHSHPYLSTDNIVLAKACVPSAVDLEDGFSQISGICAVVKNALSGKFRSTVRFWGPMFPVRTWIKNKE